MDLCGLYEQYRPFLYKISSRYVGQAEPDDLLQMAYLGLHKAALTYDKDSSVPFINYLAVCARRTIRRELDNSGTTIRIPVHMQKKVMLYKLVRQELTQKLSREPLAWEIAARMRVSVETIDSISETIRLTELTSLNLPISEDGDTTIADIVADNDREDVVGQTEQQELQRLLWPAVKECLNERQYKTICGYYREKLTFTAIAGRDGVSREAVRNSQAIALRRLRHNKHIRRLGRDYHYFGSYRHITLSEYHRTWTSSVEAEVLGREKYFSQQVEKG